jgi:hypothetical protein
MMKNSPRFTMLARCLLAVGLCGGVAWGGRAQAATYVVNPSHAAASDQGPGSEAKPFKTLEHAVQAAKAGDTVLVMPGSYGRITVGKRGTKDSPIVIKAPAAPSQAHVDKKKLLDANKPVALPGNPAANAVTKGFVLEGARFVRVENFEITAVEGGVGGIFLKDTDGVEIVGNFLHDLNPRKGNHGGIRADTHDNKNVLVKDNTLFRCAGTSICMMGEKWVVQGNDVSHGTNLNTATGENVGGEDAVRVFGKGHIIRRNYLHDFLDAEQFPKSSPHLDAFQTFSVHPESQYASDILIEENYCANIGQMFMGSDTGAKEGTNPIHDFTLRGNVFRGAKAYALIIGRGCDRFTVVNNVVAESYYGAVIVSAKSHHATVVNNIFYNNGRSSKGRPSGPAGIDESSREGSMMDYNLCNYNYTYPPRVPDYDKHSKIGVEPKFVDANAGDYRLQKDSPAIGAGDPAIKSDLGKPLDLGAFQFGRPESDWLLKFIGKKDADRP